MTLEDDLGNYRRMVEEYNAQHRTYLCLSCVNYRDLVCGHCGSGGARSFCASSWDYIWPPEIYECNDYVEKCL
jgi:hypothetical protein